MLKRKIKVKNIFQIILGIVVLLGFFYTQYELFEDKTQIFFYDVGQGDATHIRSEDIDVLIDGGRSHAVLEEMSSVMPFFDRVIEVLVLTHPDYDHHFGLIEVVKRYEVGQIVETNVLCQKKLCQTWDSLVQGMNIGISMAGKTFVVPNGSIEVLFPFEDLLEKKVEDHNDNSIVLCVILHEKTFLLMGDAGADVEKMLLERDALGSCDTVDVLKLGHHGSKTSSSKEFLSHVRPKYAIISAGDSNDYGHPHFEVLERLHELSIDILRTDTDGTISFTLTEDELLLEKET